ncbi:MAG: hypothetical protein JWP75_3784 [Frondihabitans sp.]|nr:hypothetical protein [Frondihabitans sp.]
MTSVAEKLQSKAKKPVGTKQVRLKLVYVDFWSTVKLSFLIALAIGIVTVVATFLVYVILVRLGVFTSIDGLLQEVLGSPKFTLQDTLSMGQVMLFAIVVAILNVVIGTVLGAIAAVLYNLSVRITGGLLVGFTNH